MQFYLSGKQLSLLMIPVVLVLILFSLGDVIYKKLPSYQSKSSMDADFAKRVQIILQIQKLKPSYERFKEHTQKEKDLSNWVADKILYKKPTGQAKKIQKKKAPKRYFWRLQGVIMGKVKRAIINNRLVKEGDKIGEAKIAKILPQKVLIKTDVKSKWVKLLDTVPIKKDKKHLNGKNISKPSVKKEDKSKDIDKNKLLNKAKKLKELYKIYEDIK